MSALEHLWRAPFCVSSTHGTVLGTEAAASKHLEERMKS